MSRDIWFLAIFCFAIGFSTGAVIFKIEMVTDKQLEECVRSIEDESPATINKLNAEVKK